MLKWEEMISVKIICIAQSEQISRIIHLCTKVNVPTLHDFRLLHSTITKYSSKTSNDQYRVLFVCPHHTKPFAQSLYIFIVTACI